MEEDSSGMEGRMEKKMKTRRVIVPWGFSVDEDDFNVLKDVRYSQKKVTNDGAFRVFELKSKHPLPRNIGDLDYLQSLDLSESELYSLPTSIGKLQRLEKLNLEKTENLLNLPEEIGNLVSLKELNLFQSKIEMIPSSIGKLQNLTQLNLKLTEVTTLPEEIGNLVSLEELILSQSNITTIPPSIGKLRNLREIRANHLKKLDAWPEEIGNLVSLEFLSLCGSKVTSLPSSICRLKNLMLLGLYGASALSDLPIEIGNLTNLICLDLENSEVKSFPTSFGELKNLQYLQSTTMNSDEELMVAKRHPVLLHIPGYWSHDEKVELQLGRNRARFHISEMERVPGLWPYMLKNARTAFQNRSIKIPFYVERHFDCADKLHMAAGPDMDAADAIYELLSVGRDAFIRALVGRNKTSK